MAILAVQHTNVAGGLTPVFYYASPIPVAGAPTLAAGVAGAPNGVYRAQVTFVNPGGESAGGTEATITVTNTHITWSAIPLGPTGTTARKLYRTSAGGVTGTEKLVATLPDNTTVTFDDNVADGALGATVPAASAASSDVYPNSGAQTLQIKNLSASPITVTIRCQNPCNLGSTALHDLAFAVSSGGVPALLGPFLNSFYNDPTGAVNIIYAATTLAAPGAPTVVAGAAGTPNGTYRCQVTFVNAGGETVGGTEATVTVTSQRISWSAIPLGPTSTTARKLYRTAAGGASGTEKLVTTLADNTTATFTDNVADGSLGAAVPTSNTAGVLQVAVTAP